MDLKLPKLGEGAESGTVVSVLAKEGDTVSKGQTILELETEKAVASIPAAAAGKVVKVKVKEGDRVTPGQVLMVLEGATGGDSGAAAPKKAAPAAKPAPTPEPEAEAEETAAPAAEASGGAEYQPASTATPPAAPPSIRKLAREIGLDLGRVRGSERGGRIVMADVKAYVQWLQKTAFAPKPATTKPAAPPAERIDFAQWGEITRKPMSSLRQVVSRRMLDHWTTIPHIFQFEEADITRLLELRKKHAPAYEKKGARLTVTSFVLKVLAATLAKHPLFNASLDEAAGEIVFKQYVHIGVAVDTEAGLVVPVIRNVDRKSLLELSRDLAEAAQKARDRKLSLEEMRGGSFTLSNQGGIGGGHFTPIINKPEVAILGLGRGLTKPAAREGKVEIRTFLPLCLSYDHRLIDGGNAARFIADLQQALETVREEDVRL